VTGRDGPGPGRAAAVTRFGDAAWLLETDDLHAAHRLAAYLGSAVDGGRAPEAGLEVTVGLGTVVVGVDPAAVDPMTVDLAAVDAWVSEVAGGPASPDGGLAAAADGPVAPGDVVVLPTAFDGEDLDEVAGRLGLGVPAVVALLCGAELEVAFVGFSPGFPYLVGLAAPLAGLERRATPRTSVPAGSVAVAGGFAAVYPDATPGGWQLLGRTGVTLFDPTAPPYARLRPGDRVRFVPADGAGHPGDRPDVAAPSGRTRSPVLATGHRTVLVVDGGLSTTIQDAGRRALGAVGVPAAGPADRPAMTLANRLVGNADGAPALEVTARGPTLVMEAPAHVAVVGSGPGAASLLLDGRAVAPDAVVPVGAGQVVAVGPLTGGLRAYLAVSGGVEGPLVVGSRSSDALSGLGPGPLRAGDRVDLGRPARPHGHLDPSGPLPPAGAGSGPRRWPVRVVVGPTPFDPGSLAVLTGTEWVVGPSSNRVGLRLGAGDTTVRPPSPGIPSTGMRTGAVQVPPDGRPIVLLNDHATVGGYPVVATVVSADLGRIGQAGPGDVVRFEAVGVEEARAVGRALARRMERRVRGWYPTASGT
jgi:biotin-dependent carboxylase-like uncharacterized protein